jgi:hypothetical protein
MAAHHSTSKVRSGRNPSPKPHAAGTKSQRRSATSPLDRPAFRAGLTNHIRTLREAMCVAITCCHALCNQAAEDDLEIATVLRLYCGNRLYRGIQETGVLLALFDGKTGIDRESDEITSLADPDGTSLH